MRSATWHEAVRHAFGEGSSGATLQSASLVELRRWLDARRRSIRLADLLIEVENALLDDALAEVGSSQSFNPFRALPRNRFAALVLRVDER